MGEKIDNAVSGVKETVGDALDTAGKHIEQAADTAHQAIKEASETAGTLTDTNHSSHRRRYTLLSFITVQRMIISGEKISGAFNGSSKTQSGVSLLSHALTALIVPFFCTRIL